MAKAETKTRNSYAHAGKIFGRNIYDKNRFLNYYRKLFERCVGTPILKACKYDKMDTSTEILANRRYIDES